MESPFSRFRNRDKWPFCFLVSEKAFLVTILCKYVCLLLMYLGLTLMFICGCACAYRYVLARPAGERCIVVSSHGTTVSRLRNGRILHCFPSALPNGAKKRGVAASSQVYCILDCIFHKVMMGVFKYFT